MAANKSNKKDKKVANAKGTTNCEPGSVVQCSGKTGVSVAFRWYCADTTAGLSGNTRRGDSTSLSGLPFLIGKIVDGKPQPLSGTALVVRRLPSATVLTGKLQKGRLLSADAATDSKFKELSVFAKKQGTKVPKDEATKKKLKDYEDLKKLGWSLVSVHQLSLHHLPAEMTLGVCIGVDCKTKFRSHPLWQVKTGDNDIVLDIFETYGKHAMDDKASKAETVEETRGDGKRKVDYYVGRLSGDIWMRSSHPYVESEVDDKVSSLSLGPQAKAALKKIYRSEIVGNAVEVPKDANGTIKVKLKWLPGENANCENNISNLDVMKEVPRRIHPSGYGAVVVAAWEAGITEVDFSNTWRPMLGSMMHRLGRGIDVVVLAGDKRIKLNRDGLLNGRTTDTISVEERDAYKAWMNSQKALETAKASKEKDRAQRVAKAEEAEQKAREKWEEAVEKNEPAMLSKFRDALLEMSSIITQILDPWYMDRSTSDGKDPTVNIQKDKDGLSKMHRHHMHLTIQDRELQ